MSHMENISILADRLQAISRASSWTLLYDDVVRHLKAHGVGSEAPVVGQTFPAFKLPNIDGVTSQLDELLNGGPLIINFNRGAWCPYCRAEMAAWVESRNLVSAAGARLIVISGEAGGRMSWITEMTGDRAGALCDLDQGLALALGLAFRCPDPLREALLNKGIDFSQIYDNDGWFLPVPATYALDAGGIVRFAYTEADFRMRAEPEEVIAALSKH